jgi:hypothetical protein
MTYLRLVVATLHPDSGVADGLFHTAYELRDAAEIPPAQREILQAQLAWFGRHLPIPKRFNRTSSKGYYRRCTKGISWFRDGAHEHIGRLFEIARVLEACRYTVHTVRATRIGTWCTRTSCRPLQSRFATPAQARQADPPHDRWHQRPPWQPLAVARDAPRQS